jgi:hypothetical protein
LNLFGHKTEPKVLLTYDVMMKCKCGVCPVQANSACAKPKIMARDEMMKNPSSEIKRIMTPGMMQNLEMMKNTPREQIATMMPKVEDMPGPYCANGVAVCKDLDFSKTCICSGCQVFKDFSLMKGKPMSYFCKDGKAT